MPHCRLHAGNCFIIYVSCMIYLSCLITKSNVTFTGSTQSEDDSNEVSDKNTSTEQVTGICMQFTLL